MAADPISPKTTLSPDYLSKFGTAYRRCLLILDGILLLCSTWSLIVTRDPPLYDMLFLSALVMLSNLYGTFKVKFTIVQWNFVLYAGYATFFAYSTQIPGISDEEWNLNFSFFGVSVLAFLINTQYYSILKKASTLVGDLTVPLLINLNAPPTRIV
jgi:hypothetical protein